METPGDCEELRLQEGVGKMQRGSGEVMQAWESGLGVGGTREGQKYGRRCQMALLVRF